MKSILKIAIFSLLLFGCTIRDYKYRIEGNVMVNHKSYTYVPNEPTGFSRYPHPAVAYTDSIYGQNEDSIWYYNSSGSKMTILAPYKVYLLK
jgi:hypothetical protein